MPSVLTGTSARHYCVLLVARTAGAFMHPPLLHTVIHWWVEPDRLEPSDPYQLPPKGASTYDTVPLPTRANHRNTITGTEELPARARTGKHQCTSERSLFLCCRNADEGVGEQRLARLRTNRHPEPRGQRKPPSPSAESPRKPITTEPVPSAPAAPARQRGMRTPWQASVQPFRLKLVQRHAHRQPEVCFARARRTDGWTPEPGVLLRGHPEPHPPAKPTFVGNLRDQARNNPALCLSNRAENPQCHYTQWESNGATTRQHRRR